MDESDLLPMAAPATHFSAGQIAALVGLIVFAIVMLVINLREAKTWQPCPRPRSMGEGHLFVMQRGPVFRRAYREMTDDERRDWGRAGQW